VLRKRCRRYREDTKPTLLVESMACPIKGHEYETPPPPQPVECRISSFGTVEAILREPAGWELDEVFWNQQWNGGRAGTRTPDILRVKKRHLLQKLRQFYPSIPVFIHLGNLLRSQMHVVALVEGRVLAQF
jgi:hypothetical protein